VRGCFYTGKEMILQKNWKITHDVTIDINKGFKVGFSPTQMNRAYEEGGEYH